MRLVALILTALMISGCASVISRDVLRDVDRGVTIEVVQSNPGLYTGRRVVWGGTVVSSQNLEGTTEIEVLESSLAYDDVPEDGVSRGRFIVEARGYLETALYKEGKRITVAGVVKGVRLEKIGRMDYPYPVIEPLEIRLFEPAPEYPYSEALPPWWLYDPFWPYYPYSPWPYHQRYPFYPYPYPYPWPP